MFGPVITRSSKSFPRFMSIGTTFFLSMRGCLPFLIFILRSRLNTGSVALISFASSAFAKIKSSTGSTSTSYLSSSMQPAASFERAASTFSISFASSIISSLSSLLYLTTTAGSTNKVEPVEDWS